MTSQKLLYEGKAKKVFETDVPGVVIVEFKDDATAFNGEKKGQIADKGVANAAISTKLFQLLEAQGIATHFREQLDARHLAVDLLHMIPLEVVVRNRVAGSLEKRTGLKEGTILPKAVIELYFKNDQLGDPLLNDDHIEVLQLATPELLQQLRSTATKINEILQQFFGQRQLILVDFKLEFGLKGDKLVLGDEISPDTCRLWDEQTLKKLDKDRFRRDLGGVEEAYHEVLERVLS
ncbi:phosphoribosylaminoimidazolesuccinocarboxamide synthase [Sulfobacillus thermosulfidooxidans]|uniref:phosphoribosylaminoimidazolesuccinocarboxamide synthase n=1 Tax=Sulfobacillus thermosulfidooxidans TaxID=28034 RepID=UPI00096B9F9A|nr:phosphoribosylaminoimidazolesuccinocarboxamide synthase [Sulfobacillus thermosulfidooxidans]OLZ09975.1 phosphoribosylaminoimidazolesuccinocarboxamide synthase [Sulfobacillus thermosulfidooxidans]OLZ15720.1 phosphoribosylaminoimidazolesuccinocarboxamide synthase [Sulfobacillus thermosulfidooxidans]OLZ18433.1 phosphoribosylaminoimidazolesuccinocarboxamide synthase [Sulfobacillus thermosulfidooxidans]